MSRDKERQEGWVVPIDRVEAFTSGAAMAVDPGRIEHELNSLWRQAAERAQQGGDNLAVVRASLWNFVVHVRGEAEFRRVKRLLDEMSVSVPARIIALHDMEGEDREGVFGDDGAPLRAFVEANVRPGPGGRKEMVAEEITLEARSMEARRLPGLVRSLLLADLPTAFLWTGRVPHGRGLRQIAAEADRLIIDTGRLLCAEHLLDMGQALSLLHASQVGASHGHLEIADLGWLRLSPWRLALAALFDVEEAQALLARPAEIGVRYRPDAAPGAFLLCGWLLAQLGLKVLRPVPGFGGGQVELCDAEDRRVTLVLEQVEGGAHGPLGIEAIMLRAGEAAFSATADAQCEGRMVGLKSPFVPLPAHSLMPRSDTELLVTALGAGGRDALMYRSLRASLTLLAGYAESTSRITFS